MVLVRAGLAEAYREPDKGARHDKVDAVRARMKEALTTDGLDPEKARSVFHDLEADIVRNAILDTGMRIDGRDTRTVRPIIAEVGILPRAHGSALFTRGETQAFCVATLGTGQDEQIIDALEGHSREHFMLHYNFPPYSVGEAGRMGSPGWSGDGTVDGHRRGAAARDRQGRSRHPGGRAHRSRNAAQRAEPVYAREDRRRREFQRGRSSTSGPSITEPSHSGPSMAGCIRATNSCLDGTPNNAQAGSNNLAYVPPVDAVQEFKIQTNSYDAQYGHTSGGIVNVSLKSGTNALHGTAYEFARRKAWDANSFQNNAVGAPKGEHYLDQYGGQIAGPVYIPKIYDGRNKTFFMFDYEKYRENTPRPFTLSVPARNSPPAISASW